MQVPKIRRPRYADLVATLALFFALGGTAYAATIGTSDIRNGAVTTPKLHDGAVTSAKLGTDAVTTINIQDGAVANAKLAPTSVTTGKLANGAVTESKLGTGSVTRSKLASGAVGANQLGTGSVTHNKLAANSVTGGDVAPNSLTTADLRGIDESGSVTFTLLAHSCGKLTLTVSGAAAGQAAFLTWTGAVPTHVVLGPLKVVSATQIITYACNVSGTQVTANGIGVRVITFG
jgi:hypothetical protein